MPATPNNLSDFNSALKTLQQYEALAREHARDLIQVSERPYTGLLWLAARLNRKMLGMERFSAPLVSSSARPSQAPIQGARPGLPLQEVGLQSRPSIAS